MVVDNDLPGVEMSGTVGWPLIACGFAFFVPASEAVTIVAVERSFGDRCLLFYSRACHRRFFFHKNNVPRFLRSATYIDHFSTNLYAVSCGAWSV